MTQDSSSMQPAIMVVEDNASFRRIYADGLKAGGYRVIEAGDGALALELMEKDPPDLVLLDIIIPRIDGWGVLKRMRESSKLKDIPVLVLTVLGSKEDLQKGEELGASDYTVKGFYSPKEILAKIRALLAERNIRKNISRYRVKIIPHEGDAYKLSEDFGFAKMFQCSKCGNEMKLELVPNFGISGSEVWFDARFVCDCSQR